MGKSEVISSRNNGNWIEENPLTEGNQDDRKFDIFSNAISRFAGELQLLEYAKTNEFKLADLPELNLPEFEKNFDISNAKKYSKKIQSWKGMVVSLFEDTFAARLIDLTHSGTDEIAEFELDDISPDDLKFLSEGAIFYWSVGHYMENGQSVKRSDIRFQRLITLDEDDIDETMNNVERKYSNLKERKIVRHESTGE